MATTFIESDRDQGLPRDTRRCLQMAKESRDILRDTLETMKAQIDGDGTSIAHFDLVVKRGGYGGFIVSRPSDAVSDAQRAAAKASFDELTGLYNRLTGATGTAITNACAKHGV